MELLEFKNDKPRKLKDALQFYISGISNFEILKILSKKDVKVNGKRTKDNIDLKVGDQISVYMQSQSFFDILYVDKNIVVLNKIRPIETNSNLDKQTLESELQKLYPNARAIHRLDTNTLGIVCFALNDLAEKELKNAFKNGYVVKKYVALVDAKKVKLHEKFVDYYEKDSKSGLLKVKNQGKPINEISLEYDLIEKDAGIASILVRLHTGKTHQIRAQLAHHGLYILGDGKYGDKEFNRKFKKSFQQLKSVYLHFTSLEKLKYLEEKIFELSNTF